MPLFDAFAADARRLRHDPYAIGARLRELLALDGWLACVVGVYEGAEREIRYRAAGERTLEEVGRIDAGPGHVEVIVPSAEDIHAVTAVADKPTISIHVYGADIERRGTSIYRRFDDWSVVAGVMG